MEDALMDKPDTVQISTEVAKLDLHFLVLLSCPLTNPFAVLLASTDLEWYFKDH